MKILPYYKEENRAKFSKAISLRENMEVVNEEDSILMSKYMDSCIVIDEWLSNARDVLTNNFVIPSKSFSDGTYVWDSSHIHYLRQYRARLPKEFISHVKKQIKNGFDPISLNKDMLSVKFEEMLKNMANGDESYYDASY